MPKESSAYLSRFLEKFQYFWNLFGMYQRETAVRASPAPNSLFFDAKDYSRSCVSLAKNAFRIGLNPPSGFPSFGGHRQS